MASIRFRLLAAPALLALLAIPAAAQAEATGEWGSFGVKTQYIDSAARPGDDFDRYLNGKWHDVTEVPADKSRVGAMSELDDLSQTRLRAILDELAAKRQRPGSPEARVAAAYAAYMDQEAIERAGLAPAQPWLARIRAARSRDDLLTLFASPGFASPIGFNVFADQKASDRNVLYVGQEGLGLPDRDFYLVDTPRNREIRAKYLDLLTLLLGKSGYGDARTQAEAVLALETDMARATWSRLVQRNRDLTYNKLSRSELLALGSEGAMDRLLAGVGAGRAGEAVVMQIPPTAEEITAAKYSADDVAKIGGGVPATLRLIDEKPVAVWQAWLTAHFLSGYAAFLPREIDEARFAFYGTFLNGQPKQRERWKRGIGAVEAQLGELLGKVYVERHFPPANKAAMTDLVGNLRSAMRANLSDLKWMGPATRAEAEVKLNAFTTKIGGPERFKTYRGLVVRANTPLANQIAAEDWGLKDQMARLGKPVDRSEWLMLPQTVNAYYNPIYNEIVFPAAFLQPPYFNLSADPAVNYGAIGGVIGHEMGHGFDDQGSKSDGAGNLRNWWTPEDKAAFDGLTGRLAAQYSAFCPFDDGKTCLNGRQTLGENIGDLGGLSMAYRAYQLSLHGKPAPVIDGTTGDQRFFMSWAQVWRSKTREAAARQRLVTGVHSLEQYRINGVVRNFDEWYKAFDVKPGDKLYLPPEQRVRIW